MYIKPKPLTPHTHSPFWGVLLSALKGNYLFENAQEAICIFFLKKWSLILQGFRTLLFNYVLVFKKLGAMPLDLTHMLGRWRIEEA